MWSARGFDETMMDIAANDRLVGMGLARPFPTVGYAPVLGPCCEASDSFEPASDNFELSNIDPDTPIRTSKVAAIRSAIERGTYETPEKLDLAIEAMLREL